jgi:long-chain acyl-CoA synthetase
MIGYYENPEANEAAFTSDGWFRTGDMGYMDGEGYVYITGRLKSVIVLENGKNIFPEEIEEYLRDIEEIAETVVVGRTNGEKVDLVAIIYPDRTKFGDGVSDSAIKAKLDALIGELNKTLPTYKQISYIELRDSEFEKTTSKKIKRFLVK